MLASSSVNDFSFSLVFFWLFFVALCRLRIHCWPSLAIRPSNRTQYDAKHDVKSQGKRSSTYCKQINWTSWITAAFDCRLLIVRCYAFLSAFMMTSYLIDKTISFRLQQQEFFSPCQGSFQAERTKRCRCETNTAPSHDQLRFAQRKISNARQNSARRQTKETTCEAVEHKKCFFRLIDDRIKSHFTLISRTF